MVTLTFHKLAHTTCPETRRRRRQTMANWLPASGPAPGSLLAPFYPPCPLLSARLSALHSSRTCRRFRCLWLTSTFKLAPKKICPATEQEAESVDQTRSDPIRPRNIIHSEKLSLPVNDRQRKRGRGDGEGKQWKGKRDLHLIAFSFRFQFRFSITIRYEVLT